MIESFHGSGREHRDELRLVEAGHPLEARVDSNVGDATGWPIIAACRSALADGQRHHADLVAVQAVGGGQAKPATSRSIR